MGLDSNTVTQSNLLIQASHTLTLNEKRLVLCAASLLNPMRRPPKDGFLTVSADDFATTFGMELRHSYEALADASQRLYNRNIRLYKKGKLSEEVRWVYHIRYKDGQGAVELGFSPTVLPQLTMLNKEFTSYQLRQIGSLSSFYAIRLYELMAQFFKLGTRECTLEQLRQMLDLGDKYENIKDLRKRVLDPAIKEVNRHTDISVVAEPIRKGRAITGFSFTIAKNENDQMQLGI